MPVALLRHHAICGKRPIDNTQEVYADCAFPFLEGDIAGIAANDEDRIVENIIEPAKVSRNLVDQVRNVFSFRNVDLDGASMSPISVIRSAT